MFTENDLLPLSALNHLLFCERRAAFIHVEQICKDNHFTAEGAYAHRKAIRVVPDSQSAPVILLYMPSKSLLVGA